MKDPRNMVLRVFGEGVIEEADSMDGKASYAWCRCALYTGMFCCVVDVWFYRLY